MRTDPKTMSHLHDDEAEMEAFEEPEELDSDSDELPCPSCRRPIYDDTDRCPHCGDWVMPLAAAAERPRWVWWTAVGLLLVVLLWVVS